MGLFQFPEAESEWQEPSGRTVIVQEMLNTHADSPLPPLIVYIDQNKVRSAEFFSTFEARMRKLKDCASSEVEILLPKFHVSFDREYVPNELGIHYLIDAEPVGEYDKVLDAAMELLNQRYADPEVAIAGVHTEGALSALHVDWRRRVTQAHLDAIDQRGVNYVGLRLPGMRPAVIWGNRLSNGTPILPWVAFCTAMRYALRRCALTYSDSLERTKSEYAFTEHYRYAYAYMVSRRMIHRQQQVQFQTKPDHILFQIDESMHLRRAYIALGDGQNPYALTMDDDVRSQIDALYDVDYIFKGNAV